MVKRKIHFFRESFIFFLILYILSIFNFFSLLRGERNLHILKWDSHRPETFNKLKFVNGRILKLPKNQQASFIKRNVTKQQNFTPKQQFQLPKSCMLYSSSQMLILMWGNNKQWAEYLLWFIMFLYCILHPYGLCIKKRAVFFFHAMLFPRYFFLILTSFPCFSTSFSAT